MAFGSLLPRSRAAVNKQITEWYLEHLRNGKLPSEAYKLLADEIGITQEEIIECVFQHLEKT